MKCLIKKYPQFSYAEDLLIKANINLDTIVTSLAHADDYISSICKKIKLDFFKTMLVKHKIKEHLIARGMA